MWHTAREVKFLCSSSALVQRFFSFLFLLFRVLGEDLSDATSTLQNKKRRTLPPRITKNYVSCWSQTGKYWKKSMNQPYHDQNKSTIYCAKVELFFKSTVLSGIFWLRIRLFRHIWKFMGWQLTLWKRKFPIRSNF